MELKDSANFRRLKSPRSTARFEATMRLAEFYREVTLARSKLCWQVLIVTWAAQSAAFLNPSKLGKLQIAFALLSAGGATVWITWQWKRYEDEVFPMRNLANAALEMIGAPRPPMYAKSRHFHPTNWIQIAISWFLSGAIVVNSYCPPNS